MVIIPPLHSPGFLPSPRFCGQIAHAQGMLPGRSREQWCLARGMVMMNGLAQAVAH